MIYCRTHTILFGLTISDIAIANKLGCVILQLCFFYHCGSKNFKWGKLFHQLSLHATQQTFELKFLVKLPFYENYSGSPIFRVLYLHEIIKSLYQTIIEEDADTCHDLNQNISNGFLV